MSSSVICLKTQSKTATRAEAVAAAVPPSLSLSPLFFSSLSRRRFSHGHRGPKDENRPASSQAAPGPGSEFRLSSRTV